MFPLFKGGEKKMEGGGEVNKRAALLTNTLFPCSVQHSTVDTETRREAASVLMSLSETNKTAVRGRHGRVALLLLFYTQLRCTEVLGLS